MISIFIPNNNIAERKYILDLFFDEFLNLDYEIIIKQDIDSWEINLQNGKKIVFKDHFFNNFKNDLEYLSLENIPKKVNFTKNKFTPQEDMPIIYGVDKFDILADKIICDIDIFASSFFMLSRWEEYVNKNRDNHDRFMAKDTLGYKFNFIDRPIVNEYIQFLKNIILNLDDSLNFKIFNFKTLVTCDVDEPFDPSVRSLYWLCRTCIADILKRKSISKFLNTIKLYVSNKFGNFIHDKNYTFQWYIDTCKRANLNPIFYFIPDSSEKNNGFYSLDDKKIQQLMVMLAKNNCEIGVHGSYNTYKDGKKLLIQKKKLEEVLKTLNINQNVIGNRQHYLRWDSVITPKLLDDAGFTYDTTGGYADAPGFRYGICYEFSMFDFLNRKKLNLKEMPLIVMECSVFDDESYMMLDEQSSIKLINNLKNKCCIYDGNFVLLFHNSNLKSIKNKNIFKKIINETKAM